MQIVIDIPEAIYNTAKHTNILEANADALAECIRNGTVLPNNSTNGEVIQALFPNIYEGFSNVIDLNLWWNAKYKAKEQSE